MLLSSPQLPNLTWHNYCQICSYCLTISTKVKVEYLAYIYLERVCRLFYFLLQ